MKHGGAVLLVAYVSCQRGSLSSTNSSRRLEEDLSNIIAIFVVMFSTHLDISVIFDTWGNLRCIINKL